MNNNTPQILPPLEEAKKQLHQAQFKASDQITEGLLAQNPENIEALYILAVSLRQQQRYQEAQDTLSEIHKLAPNHARAYQEGGHLHFTQNQSEAALIAYKKAVSLNPTLLASWKALVNLYRVKQLPKQHDDALHQVLFLEQFPPQLQTVKSYLHEGKLDEADELCRYFLRSNKQHIEGMRLLAEIANQLRVIDDAEFILESCTVFEPGHLGARVDYANTLIKRQKFGKALEVSESLYKAQPSNPHFKAIYAASKLGVGDTTAAIDLLQQVAKSNPDQGMVVHSLGHAYKTLGDIENCVDSYRQAYVNKPDFGDAFWSLANIKTYQFTAAEIEHMLRYEALEETSIYDQVHFCFALGKAYEDNKEFEKAFTYYERGNSLNIQRLNYSTPLISERVHRQIEICTPELFQQHQDVGHHDHDPIFIVGLPRAGSTLLEQILASHSQVDGTMELPNIPSLAYKLRGRHKQKQGEEPKYPRVLTELTADHYIQFGQQYLDDTQTYRQGAPLFIDKMPNNFLHIGLIKLILPNAKIIDARRHPMACCFSGFKQLFAEGQEFTYGLKEIGAYYREYVRLMDHWEQVLPGFVLRVQHEDVVEDLETQVRSILEFCKLPFEENCLNYHKTARSIRTPSAEQVRQPIYKTGLEQWRNFEPWLAPLKDALGDEVLKRYPID